MRNILVFSSHVVFVVITQLCRCYDTWMRSMAVLLTTLSKHNALTYMMSGNRKERSRGNHMELAHLICHWCPIDSNLVTWHPWLKGSWSVWLKCHISNQTWDILLLEQKERMDIWRQSFMLYIWQMLYKKYIFLRGKSNEQDGSL